MGKKDDYQSQFFDSKKRFADAFNGCLFGGKTFMKAGELEETDSVIVIPSFEAKSTKVICDKIRKWKGNYVSILVLESQTYIDYQMVLRAMKGDLANYEKQRAQAYQDALDAGWEPSADEFLSRAPKDLKLIPVITLVIYIGTDGPWDGKTELYDLLDIDDELKPYVSNYRFNLFDYNDHKDFSAFKTENRTLFEVLSNSGDKEKMLQCLENSPYNNTNDPDVVTAILGSIGIKPDSEKLKKLKNKETGGYDMCKAVRDMIDEGISIGKKEGISIGKSEGILIGKKDGILEGTIRTLFSMVNDNLLSLSDAAKRAAVTEERFMELAEQFHLNGN